MASNSVTVAVMEPMRYMITQGTLGIKLQWLPKGHVRLQAESGWLPDCQAGTGSELGELEVIKPPHRPVPIANVSEMNNVRVKDCLQSTASASFLNDCFFFLLDNGR